MASESFGGGAPITTFRRHNGEGCAPTLGDFVHDSEMDARIRYLYGGPIPESLKPAREALRAERRRNRIERLKEHIRGLGRLFRR